MNPKHANTYRHTHNPPSSVARRQIAEVHGSRALINFLDLNIEKLDVSSCELDALPEQVLLHGTKLQQLKLAKNR